MKKQKTKLPKYVMSQAIISILSPNEIPSEDIFVDCILRVRTDLFVYYVLCFQSRIYKIWTGRAGTAKNRDGTWDKMGQSRKGSSKTGNGYSKTEKDVLKKENDVLKHEIRSFSYFRTSFSCVLCSFGKVILSRDVLGQRFLSRDICSCPCPGTSRGTSRSFSLKVLKFIYSEKVTKFCKISTIYLTGTT